MATNRKFLLTLAVLAGAVLGTMAASGLPRIEENTARVCPDLACNGLDCGVYAFGKQCGFGQGGNCETADCRF
jgi:hypothetical protein